MASAQASGGQISRSTHKQRTEVKKSSKQRNNTTQAEQSTPTYIPPAIKSVSIEPISISSLQKYNVVVESCISLASAQIECKKLRDAGFNSEIILDTSNMFRLLMYFSTNSEEDAQRYRNRARDKYPKAWIMCVENGRTYRYNK